MVLAMTWIGQIVDPWIGYRGVAWIFLTLIVAMATFIGRGAILPAAALSALLWDFLFEQPLYSFSIASVEDRILFLMYLVMAVTLGHLVTRIRAQEKLQRGRQASGQPHHCTLCGLVRHLQYLRLNEAVDCAHGWRGMFCIFGGRTEDCVSRRWVAPLGCRRIPL